MGVWDVYMSEWVSGVGGGWLFIYFKYSDIKRFFLFFKKFISFFFLLSRWFDTCIYRLRRLYNDHESLNHLFFAIIESLLKFDSSSMMMMMMMGLFYLSIKLLLNLHYDLPFIFLLLFCLLNLKNLKNIIINKFYKK